MKEILIPFIIIPTIFCIILAIQEIRSPYKIYKDTFLFKGGDTFLSIGYWFFHITPIAASICLYLVTQ